MRSRSFVLLVALFMTVTALVYGQATAGIDEAVQAAIYDSTGDPALDWIMQFVTETGDVFNMLLFGIIILIIPKTRRIGVTLMILIVISTLLAGYIKCGVDRDGPAYDYEGVPFPIDISRDTFALFCEGSFAASYPSGHVARAVIFGVILGYALSERFPRGAYLVMLYPVLISASRIYVMQHYLMDVIGGAILGVMLAGVLASMTHLSRIFEKRYSG